MRCKKVQDLLPLYVGEDLTPNTMRSIERHLSRCLTCYRMRRDYDHSLEDVRLLAELEAVAKGPSSCDPDGDFVEAVMARAKEPGPAAPVPTGGGDWITSIARDATIMRGLSAAAAILILVVGTGFLATRSGSSVDGANPPSMTVPGGTTTSSGGSGSPTEDRIEFRGGTTAVPVFYNPNLPLRTDVAPSILQRGILDSNVEGVLYEELQQPVRRDGVGQPVRGNPGGPHAAEEQRKQKADRDEDERFRDT